MQVFRLASPTHGLTSFLFNWKRGGDYGRKMKNATVGSGISSRFIGVFMGGSKKDAKKMKVHDLPRPNITAKLSDDSNVALLAPKSDGYTDEEPKKWIVRGRLRQETKIRYHINQSNEPIIDFWWVDNKGGMVQGSQTRGTQKSDWSRDLRFWEIDRIRHQFNTGDALWKCIMPSAWIKAKILTKDINKLEVFWKT